MTPRVSDVGWVRLEDNVYDHPKLIRVSKGTRWVWVAALAYSNRHLTDGFVPKKALKLVEGSPADARHLVHNGLWEIVDGGWLIHDYAKYQKSRTQVENERASARDRMGRIRSNNGRTSSEVREKFEPPNPTQT
jgi:hypothetical protein